MPTNTKPATRGAIGLRAYLPYRLTLLAHRLAPIGPDLDALGHRLTVQEWKVFCIVADNGPVTPLDIRRHGTQDKSTISWALKRLVRHGLLATRPKPGDGRTFEALITDEGWRYYKAAIGKVRKRATRALAGLTAAERAELLRLIDKVDPQ